MNTDRKNRWLSGVLFSGLGLFAWLLLTGYTNLSPATEQVLKTPWGALFLAVLFNALGFLTLRISAWLNAQYLLHARRRWKIAAAYLGVLGMFFVVDYGFLVTGKLLAGAQRPFTFPNGGVRMLVVVWLVELAVLGLLLSNRAMAQTLRLRQRTAELQRENNTARYTALQQQLNPHFLFNSLNTLIAEIEYNPQGAVGFTRNLSDVYRYILTCQDKHLVSLHDEMGFVDTYVQLHRVRLGDCLTVDWQVADAIREEAQLPPLTLQLLVENIVKHNVISPSRPMTVTVEALTDGEGSAWLRVSNPVHPKLGAVSGGHGLKNLAQRYRLLCGKEIVVQKQENCFDVKVPLLYE